MIALDLHASRSLAAALGHADDLIGNDPDLPAHPEYIRGQVELIASLYGTGGGDDAAVAVAALLGVGR